MNRFTATITAMAAAIAIAASSDSWAQIEGQVSVNYPPAATVVVPDWIAGATRAPQWGGAVGGDLAIAGQGERAVEISGGLLRQAEESNIQQLDILAQASAPRCATYSCMTPCCQARRYAVCVQPSPPAGFVYRPPVVLPNPPAAIVAYPPQPQVVLCGGGRQQQQALVVVPGCNGCNCKPAKPQKQPKVQPGPQQQQQVIVVPGCNGCNCKPAKPQKQPKVQPGPQQQQQVIIVVQGCGCGKKCRNPAHCPRPVYIQQPDEPEIKSKPGSVNFDPDDRST